MLQQKINASAKALGFTTKFMQSSAGHDAQDIALLAPVAMIFCSQKAASVIHPKILRRQFIWLMAPMFYYKLF
jgi:N-carbamoyl-L-amino-acid hydrolase